MLRRRIGSSSDELPVIGLGTYAAFDVADHKPLVPVLRAFVDAGASLVDSSPMYGRSESVVGHVAHDAHVADKLFVATKVWTSGRERGIAQMEASIAKLGGRVDLMQVHNLVDVDVHLATLADWKRAGRIRYVGITHYTAGALDDVERTLLRHKDEIDFVQINYSLAERDADARLLDVCRANDVAVIANRPLGGGALASRLARTKLPAFAAAELACTSWTQLALKWIVGHPAITCAIPATSSVEHMRDNVAAGHGPMPDAKQRAAIVDAIS